MYKLLLVTLDDLEEKHFKRFKRLLSHDLPEGFTALEGKRHESFDKDDTVDLLIEKYGSDGSLRVTLHILKSDTLQRNDLAQDLQERSKNVSKTEARWEKAQKEHIANLKGKYESIHHASVKKQVPLKEIHTELLIIEGRHEGISFEHEVMLIEQASKMEPSQALLIKMDEIFISTGPKRIKIVMTTGISGIGKTITVQKFVLDWAEGNCNQIIQFTCVLSFRELNLMEDDKSFLQLIYLFHPEMRVIDVDKFKELKILFIFDGLDESKLPLDFANNKVFSELDKVSSIDALLTNLIKGHLLEGSWIWITSRPAAAHKVPSNYIDRFTEIRGFTNDQKEEYFHKATQGDKELATRIISHIKSVRSLHIMCHSPMFCRISASVLKDMMREDDGAQTKIPRTLTAMYIHYLLIQICVKSEKYDGSNQGNPKELSSDDRKLLLALGKLAFRQLQSGGIFFEEDDVKACGIDVDTASLHSGMCTEIIKLESGLYNKKMFCFVHLSIQELFAALHVLYEFGKTNRNLLCTEKSLREKYMLPSHVPITFGKKEESDDEDYTYFPGYAFPQYGNVTTKFRKLKGTDCVKMESCNVFTSLSELHKNALDLALKSNTGHLDLFVRFLLGISLENNLTLVKKLWTPTVWNSGSFEDSEKNIGVTIEYIMHNIRGDPPSGSVKRENHSPERLINLFHCLSELNHSRLQEEVLTALSSQSNRSDLMAPHCSALAYILMTSDHNDFDLKSYNAHPQGHHRLMPVVKHCKTVLMDYSQIQLETYDAVAAALSSANNCITELDLSNNIAPGEGISPLCNGLKNPNCKLQILRLQRCSLTEKSCASLATVFSSDATKLEFLSVSGNDLYDSGAKLLLSGLLASPCKLQTLCLESCGLTWEVCEAVAEALSSAGSSLRELDLSSNDLRDMGVQRLCSLLGTIPCALQTLRLGDCSLTEACCFDLASALCSAMSGLSYLDLMHNRLKDCGVQLLCTALREPGCQLQKLGLSGCDVTDIGYGHLASAIYWNPACLRELDLGFEHKDEPRLKPFASLLDDPSCRLEEVVLSKDRETRRATLLQHGCHLTFDDTSMCLMLSLSEDNRTVSCTERRSIDGAHHPERFACPQVLCREGLTGCCYWEAEWKGQACYIGLTPHRISRSGEECIVGYSNASWCLMCHKNSYQLIHNKQMLEKVFTSGLSQRVGVFLDSSKGSISFYIVSKDAAQLLHQVHTDITEALYPGFYVGPNTSILLCQLE